MILVVTRREQEGQTICSGLRIAGKRALLATRGREALELAAYQPPALVVQDIVLPDMDGTTMIAALRELPALGGLPAIAIAGAPPATSPDAVGPFHELLIKPVDVSELVTLAGELLAPPALPPSASRARILLVDDNAAQRRLMTLRLQHSGYHVTLATNGGEALELARSSHVDAVVSDVLMPGIDGFELARALRSDEGTAALPVVLTSSAFVDAADFELATAAGASAFVARTPDLAELLSTIGACLASTPAHDPTGAQPARQDDVERRYGERMAVHLDRHVRVNAQLRARLAAQSVELAVLADLGGEISLSGTDYLLDEVLARCAEVTGFGCGAVYLSAGAGAPVLQGWVGFQDGESLREFFGAPELLTSTSAGAGITRLSLDEYDERVQGVLRTAGLSVILIAPVSDAGQPLGVLVLGSPRGRPTADQESFLAAVAGQLGQSLARVRALNALARSQRRMVERLTRAVEFRNEETANHTERVSRYAALLAARTGIDDRRVELVAASSAMHDIGKLGVPDRILLKPANLTLGERAEMERHADYGRRILAGEPDTLLDLAAVIAWTHHERWDGAGYPRRLRGPEIPLEGRIVSICDVFDALTCDRVYRPAWSVPDALALMRSGRGTQFDPQLLDRFIEALPRVLEIRARHPNASAPS